MATSKNFGQLADRLRIRALLLERNVEEVVKAAAIAADQVVVLGTPVDTGRARNNWIASVGPVPLGGERGADPSGSQAIALARQAIDTYKIVFKKILIANNVPYIAKLNGGSSQQAPMGFTSQALAAAIDVAEATAKRLFREQR